MKIDFSAIGKRIQCRRRQQKKTQDELAEALLVSVGYVSQIERGVTKISLETLAGIADFLGCSIGE
ncbi:MAG: helix-turn-helix transcriptional regulator, partial [Oscillospiraceae bacterium]